VRREALEESLRLLEQSTRALRSNTVDDVHLSVRFASLLETHIKELSQRFVRIPNPAGSSVYTPYTPNLPRGGMQNSDIADYVAGSDVQRIQADKIPSQTNYTGGGSSSASMADLGEGAFGSLYDRAGINMGEEGSSMRTGDWLALPPDLSNVPFENGLMQTIFGFEADDAYLFWSAPR
jgi:hypothetical protein